MDESTTTTTVVSEDGAAPAAGSQRRSGRVVRPPAKYMPEPAPAPAVKRKRSTGYDENGHPLNDEDDDDEDDVDNDGNEDEDEEEEDEDDEDNDDANDGDHEERRARPKRRNNAPSSSHPSKRASKKPKLNGASSHAANLPRRPKKAVRVTIEGDHDSQLYADIFSSGDDGDDVAARWYEHYQNNNLEAVADLVNCILSAAGCDHHVGEDDINDPDNCSNRLTELQGIYEDEKITEYPLIAKSRSTRSFRELLVQFFHSLINVLHETEVLYDQPALMENVVRWVASLSSSTLRPFRHTATTVALAMLAALVQVAKKLDERINKMTHQVEAQKSRQKGKAKDARVTAFEANLREAGKNRERAAALMKEFFDTVFVHRYRDIDPRIRTECIEALGSWVWQLPAVYMQPEYLRYLGWMLSDSNPSTRQEVLKQLARVFHRDAGNMGHFVDRFRPRLIEMATKDADTSVRVMAIAVVEQLRKTGMLEPDEIDEIGKLIFDAELRIRKAVVNFFADCIKDFAAVKFEEVRGGEEALKELFGKGQSKTGQYDAPRRDWIYVKSLADTIAAYEEQLGTKRSELSSAHGLNMATENAGAAAVETSRLALATQVLVDKIPEITNWEILAGYLLFDHSIETKGRGRSKPRTTEMAFRAAVAPAEHEEAILLEVLTAAAKASLTPGSESERLRRKGADQGVDTAETAALELASLIPQLLRKFGAEPATAVTVLRLQHSLNLGVFRQLRQDTATFDGLLDEICTQFSRHADAGVIAEAAASLLHARQYAELEEVVDNKVAALWENAINALRNFDKTCELSARRNLSASLATELSVTLFKMAKLASIADCVDVLEAEGTTTSADSTEPVIDILVKTVHRGKFEEVDEDLDSIEDSLTANAIGACQFYFMWKVRSLVLAVEAKSAIANDAIDQLAIRKRSFDQNLVHTFSSRGYNDDLRLYATGVYCDLHVLFASLRKRLGGDQATMAKYVSLGRLIDQVPAALIAELISIFDAAERTFAKKTKKTLNEPADDEDPVADPLDDDEDDEDEDDDDNNDEDGSGFQSEHRRAAELKTERALCDLTSHYVMAIVARVLDQGSSSNGNGQQHAGKLQKRLLRNQTKLGHSYKEIVAFLDESKATEVLLANNRKKAGGSSKAKGKSVAMSGGGGAGGGPGGSGSAGGAGGAGGPGDSRGHLSSDSVSDGHHLVPPTPGAMHDDYGGILLGAPTPAANLDDLDNLEDLGDINELDNELDDLLDTPEPEEGTVEDLRRRELLEPAMDDDDDDDEEEEEEAAAQDDDDDILGD